MPNEPSCRAGRSRIISSRPRTVTGNPNEEWPALASALLRHASTHEVVEVTTTPFGQNYAVEGPLPAPDGRAPNVRVVWFIANGAETATLATAYPLGA